MKKTAFLIIALMLVGGSARALDPVAPRSSRGHGRIVVHTPQPDSDTVTVSSVQGSGGTYNPKPGETIDVPIGEYQVSVKMQDYSYVQEVSVDPTETSFIVVPGYGSLKVNSLHASDKVTVTDARSGQVVATFPASQTKILPRGYYNIRVEIPGSLPAVKDNVWVVTNTTRIVDISKS